MKHTHYKAATAKRIAFFVATGAALLFAQAPLAEEGQNRHPMGKHHQPPKSLEEAKERTEKKLEHLERRKEKLDGMTQEQWEQHQKRRAQHGEKWEGMPEEERNAARERMREHRQQGDGMPHHGKKMRGQGIGAEEN